MKPELKQMFSDQIHFLTWDNRVDSWGSELIPFNRFVQSIAEDYKTGKLPTPAQKQAQQANIQALNTEISSLYGKIGAVSPQLAEEYKGIVNRLWQLIPH